MDFLPSFRVPVSAECLLKKTPLVAGVGLARWLSIPSLQTPAPDPAPDVASSSEPVVATEQPLDSHPAAAQPSYTPIVVKGRFQRGWLLDYSWLEYDDSIPAMFCKWCKQHGVPPAGTRGAWVTRGISNFA